MTMDYLVTSVMDRGEGRVELWYDFVWNRTRAIRKVKTPVYDVVVCNTSIDNAPFNLPICSLRILLYNISALKVV